MNISKKTQNILFALLLTAGLFSIAAYAALTPTTACMLSTPTPPPLMEDLNHCDLNDIKLWKTLVVMMSVGAVGGLVFELLNLKGNIEWPHGPTKDELAAKFAYATPDNLYDLGYLARLIIGALSAPPTIAIVRPDSAFAMLTISLVAGSSGALVFRALQDRLVASIYQREKDQEQQEKVLTEIEANKPIIKTKLQQAITNFKKLEKKLRELSKTNEATLLVFPEGGTIDPQDFDKVWQPLNEAQGMNAQLDDVMETFKKIETHVREISESPDSTSLWNIKKGEQLDPADLDKVEKLLNEANGLYEMSRAASGSTPASATGSETTPKSQLDEVIHAFTELKDKLLTLSTRPAGTMTLKFTPGTFLEQHYLAKVKNLLRDMKSLVQEPDISIDEVINAFVSLETKLIQSSTSPVGTTILQFTDNSALEQDDLDNIENLLQQIKS